MISLNSFSNDGHGQDLSIHDAKAISVQDIEGLYYRDMTPEQVSDLQCVVHAKGLEDDKTEESLSAFTLDRFQHVFGSTLCHALAQVLTYTVRTRRDAHKNRLFLLFEDIVENTEKSILPHRVVCKALHTLLVQEKKYLRLKKPEAVGEEKEAIAHLGDYFSEACKLLADPASSIKDFTLLKARLERDFPPNYYAHFSGVSKAQPQVNLLGCLLQDFTNPKQTHAALKTAFQGTQEANTYGKKLSDRFVENSIKVGQFLKGCQVGSAQMALHAMHTIGAVLSKEAFGWKDGSVGLPLAEIREQFQDLGTRNGWGDDLPASYLQAWVRYYPVERVYNSETGMKEVWACKEAKFYFDVDCS